MKRRGKAIKARANDRTIFTQLLYSIYSLLLDLNALVTYNRHMKARYLQFCCFSILFAIATCIQAQPSQGMQTYSPYTPEQMRELNNQPIFPVEGPMGPVGPGAQVVNSEK